MSRYILAAGFAASEVGGLLILTSIIGLAMGVQSWGFLLHMPIIVGLGAWLWWKKSLLAAVLMLAVVAADYSVTVYGVGGNNPFMVAYLVFFPVAFAGHGRKPKDSPEPLDPRGSKGK